jgi:hypothetical protein
MHARLLAILLLFLATPALARECPLSRADFEPVDKPGSFTMSVSRDGHGYRFALRAASGRTVNFIGSFQNGTGHLNIDEDRPAEAEGDALESRVLLFRADLKSADAWNKGQIPVAYMLLDRLSTAMWDRARADAKDDQPDAAPPDGLWRVRMCRPR